MEFEFLDGIRVGPESFPPGDYAMWFPSEAERSFIPSETRQNLRHLSSAVLWIETYVFAALMKHLGVVDEQVRRLGLPDQLATFSVVGPEGQVFVLSASQEKGIRFHFEKSASPAYRNQVLSSFIAFAEMLKRAVTLAGAPLDEVGDESPAKWWALCDQMVSQTEATREPVEAVGKVLVG
jgi:hypothetical protein